MKKVEKVMMAGDWFSFSQSRRHTCGNLRAIIAILRAGNALDG